MQRKFSICKNIYIFGGRGWFLTGLHHYKCLRVFLRTAKCKIKERMDCHRGISIFSKQHCSRIHQVFRVFRVIYSSKFSGSSVPKKDLSPSVISTFTQSETEIPRQRWSQWKIGSSCRRLNVRAARDGGFHGQLRMFGKLGMFLKSTCEGHLTFKGLNKSPERSPSEPKRSFNHLRVRGMYTWIYIYTFSYVRQSVCVVWYIVSIHIIIII